MARLMFPDEGSRLVYLPAPSGLRPVPGGTVVSVYLDAAASTPADCQHLDGSAVSVGSPLQVDAYSRLPLWLGPADGTAVLYVVMQGGPAVAVAAALAGRVAGLERLVPAGWGSIWRPARAAAAAGTGKARVTVLGASVGQGFYASDLEATSWVSLVRSGLQAQYGDGGSGFRGVFDTALFLDDPLKAAYYGGIANNLWTLTGAGWDNIDYVSGPTGKDAIITNTGGTASIVVRGRTVSIYTLDAGAGTGTWTYAIDGGAPVTVNAPAVYGARKTTVTGLAAGNHTVVLTSVSGYLMVCGVSGENATGVMVNNVSKSAAEGAQWNGLDGPPVSADWAGGVNYPADLVIWNLSENEVVQGSVNVPTAVLNVRRYFDRIRDNATTGGAVELAILLDHAGTYDSGSQAWHDLSAQLASLAATYGAAMFNLWTAGRNSWHYWNSLHYWGNPANPTTSGTDFVHPSDAGHAYIAGLVADVLTS